MIAKTTVAEALAEGRRSLTKAHGDSARIDASRLLEHATGKTAAWLLAHDDAALAPLAIEAFEAMLRRRERGEPIAYIIGSAGFYGRAFTVTPAVMIPRPETEQLAELAIAHLRAIAAPAFCDIGTGSGILPITIACELPSATCTAFDISSEALEIARRNAASHDVATRVTFALGDLLAAAAPASRYDCITANLPYVPTQELAPPPDPTTFEPVLALDGGPDGLTLYRRLLQQLPAHTNPKAVVLLEAGPTNAAPLAALATAAFPTAKTTIHRDYGNHPRTIEIALL